MRRVVLLAMVAACSRPVPSTGGAGGTGGAIPGAQGGSGGAPQVAVPAAPVPVPLVAQAIGPDGAAMRLDPTAIGSIAPGSSFVLESPEALVDLRVRLVDEADRLVPSRDSGRVGQGTTYRLVPEEPLAPGTAFKLVVSGQSEAGPASAAGVRFEGRAFELRTTGDKPPPPAPPRRHRRRHR